MLEGVRVLEKARGVAPRYCGHLQSRLGATAMHTPRGDDERIGWTGAACLAYGRWLDDGKVAPDGGPCDVVNAGRRLEPRCPAPTLGDHTESVLAEGGPWTSS